ncbi:Ies2p [Lachancea thermotolerans CBS 6340]|uniref:KLTH0B07942p n=1 Tax=Lachancea thermotolerans (strain ATCC 56472 / CBS 6340 / NRRL Y-8284) TaxID=559295 RepID=C5DD34_LACTC|nr:KLTH0B07942p [Lachancea thermotolerans CBS 6340]CAR21695.1 KLTH0B07942p [Lachancea thermotolerans CBS 6340]
MDSDLSSVGSEDEIYEETPEVAEEELIGSEPEDDEYQYTPDDYEEDEETGQRSKSGSRSSRRAATNEPRASNRKRAPTDEFEEPGSSPAKRARRNGAIDLQNLDDDDDDDDDTSSASQQKLNSRNKMISELMDNTSRRSSKLTDQELQLRRAENARKRKNLSEKKLEEEKQDTINKLLRRRAGKSRAAMPAAQEQENDAANYVKPRRAYNAQGLVRTLRKKDVDIYATY